MSASLIRSRALITHGLDRHRWNEVNDGAVLQEDGTIVAPTDQWSASCHSRTT